MTNDQAPIGSVGHWSLVIGHWCLVFYSGMHPLAGSIRPILLLPDWHVLLDGVNEPLASGEGLVAVRRADGDGDAGFAQLQMAQAVNDGAAGERPAAASFGFQLGQLFFSHFGVALIVERDRAAAVREFASGSEEQHNGAGVA